METNQPTPLIVFYEDESEMIHSDESPFCQDSTCPCHDDRRRKYELVAAPWYAGLLTARESQRLFSGEQLAAYRCACPLLDVACQNSVGAPNGLCANCANGDHRGHGRGRQVSA